MITIICATHRPQNQTLMVVEKYKEMLREMGEKVRILQMAELPAGFIHEDSFGKRTEIFEEIIHLKIVPAEKFVIISPEYNGSYPGIFKAFLDAVKPAVWLGKKVALVGVASGRAGNLRGMDHLTDVLHHLRAEVFSLKVPISGIHDLLDEKGVFSDTATLEVLQLQATQFLKY